MAGSSVPDAPPVPQDLQVQSLTQRLVNIGHLLSGSFGNAAIMLVSVAVAARALGPEIYGVMVLVLAYGRTVERVLRFESWQPLIRYTALEEGEPDRERLGRLYALGLMLDVSTALLAALVTWGGAALLGPLFGLDPAHVGLVAIYAAALAVNITGVPTAALRMAGRFRILAYSQLAANILRIGLAMLCAHQQWGIAAFILSWTIAQIAGSLLFLWLGYGALRSLGIPGPFSVRWRGLRASFPGFMSFAWSTNLSMTMRTLTQEADSLLVGALAGPAAASFYYLAKRIGKVAQQVGAQVQAVIYPDVARIWARGQRERFRSTVLQTQAALAGVGLAGLAAAWLLGEWIIRIGPGALYAAAYPLLLTQLVAVVLTMHAAPSRSALLAMHRPGLVLAVSAVGVAIFLGTSFLAIPHLGAIGANIAHIALAGFTAVILDIAWLRGSRAGHPEVPASLVAAAGR
ncbi:lipopolysaccharide biosynthesis protein [Sphingosinicella sp. BN140058]|uniref:lipopolysaccharide biosynthesis protein n=1 Tax=Sphingosinicella sp. BN140058 TaxID=1892855 RepID=UPI001012D0CC|nr:lipopolysaccharide biosynthesis protein [Sphingosinicella sp. BN140058]QAY78044.1 lipopolysaccharide biosynthesis protein [Sphingosinicella sp. BN140058]